MYVWFDRKLNRHVSAYKVHRQSTEKRARSKFFKAMAREAKHRGELGVYATPYIAKDFGVHSKETFPAAQKEWILLG